jgi:uncharacterized membrane protein
MSEDFMNSGLWDDRTPSRRCDWLDQLRGWAVIIMIEVHCVNVWVHRGWTPDWLNYLNGLVAPSFILCAGYSLALSTFRPDGTLRPFRPTARRLGFILLCAYLLHAPGLTLVEWTFLSTAQKYRELFKIDVLQCIVFSLLLLNGLARLIRRPLAYAGAALGLGLAAAWAAPHLWKSGVADGLWLPVRGLVNGNTDRGVTALFPLFPWLAFAAFGSVLGALYRHLRVLPVEGRARWSEGRWLLALGLLGAALAAWGTWAGQAWLWNGAWSREDALRLFNTTLPSVVQRTGVVCMAGALMGWVERWRPRLPGPNLVDAASRESLLLYMLHLNLIFTLLLAEPIARATGWTWQSLGWTGTLALTAALIAVNLAAGVAMQRGRASGLAPRLQRLGVRCLLAWFLLGGWISFHCFYRSPELATEPYPFLNHARARKGLPPTEDGLSREPLEKARERARLHLKLNDEDRRMLESHRD